MPLSYGKEILMKKTVYQILAVIFSLTILLASCGRESDPADTTALTSDADTAISTSVATTPEETAPQIAAEQTETIPEGALTSRLRVTAVGADGVIYLGDIVIGAGHDFYDADGNKLPVKGNIAVGDWLEIIHDPVMTPSIPTWFGQIYRITRVAE